MASEQKRQHTIADAFADLLGEPSGPTAPHFIVMRYSDGTGAAGGPWSEQQARRRAAVIYRQLPTSMVVGVAPEPKLPVANDGSTFMVVASYVGPADGPTRRIVFGWWPSAQAAYGAATAVLDQAPDASSVDYAIDLHDTRTSGENDRT